MTGYCRTLRRERLCTAISVILTVALAVVLLSAFRTYAAQKTVMNTITRPAAGSTELWISGSYAAGQKAALDRINELRYEACVNGYPDPRDRSRNLTADDYVPIKWSAELERYARLRACEAAIRPSHSRPGQNEYIDENNRYLTGGAEVLAWGTSTLKGGVELWYSEKKTWVSGGSGVTGHYTSMISPSNHYVGIGSFRSGDGLGCSWRGSVCGRFSSSTAALDETMAPELKDIIQPVSIYNDSIKSGPELTITDYDGPRRVLYQAEKPIFAVIRNLSIDGENMVLLEPGDFSYSSSRPACLRLSPDGIGTALFKGKVTVKASASDGRSYTLPLTVKNILPAPKLKSAVRKGSKAKVRFRIRQSAAAEDTGFEIHVSKNRKFTKNVRKAVVRTKFKWGTPVLSYSKTISGLKGKPYYARVREYIKTDGRKYYSAWSAVKKLK